MISLERPVGPYGTQLLERPSWRRPTNEQTSDSGHPIVTDVLSQGKGLEAHNSRAGAHLFPVDVGPGPDTVLTSYSGLVVLKSRKVRSTLRQIMTDARSSWRYYYDVRPSDYWNYRVLSRSVGMIQVWRDDRGWRTSELTV